MTFNHHLTSIETLLESAKIAVDAGDMPNVQALDAEIKILTDEALAAPKVEQPAYRQALEKVLNQIDDLMSTLITQRDTLGANITRTTTGAEAAKAYLKANKPL